MKHKIPLNILPYIAAAAVAGHRFVSITTTGASQATTSTAVVGVSGPLDVAAGHAVDIVTAGFIPVEYGEAIVAGDRVGSSAVGKAVKKADGGFVALEDGADGTIGSVMAVLA